MTLIIRLCVLCAVSSLMEMVVSGTSLKERMRLICGLLMLKMTLSEICSLGNLLTGQKELSGIFRCLIR